MFFWYFIITRRIKIPRIVRLGCEEVKDFQRFYCASTYFYLLNFFEYSQIDRTKPILLFSPVNGYYFRLPIAENHSRKIFLWTFRISE